MYTSIDGLIVSSNLEIVNRYDKELKKLKSDTDIWITKLRRKGIKAAHPENGLVNKERNKMYMIYPYFCDGIKEGDKIAIGDSQKYRIVKVTAVNSNLFNMVEYSFK